MALGASLGEAFDHRATSRWRRVVTVCALTIAVADGIVVAGLVLVDLVKMAVELGDWAAGLVAVVVGAGR